jgi:hypothetical protein
MGYEMAKMEDVNWCVRNARKAIKTFGNDKGEEANKFAEFILELVVRNLYRDEIKSAKSDEEKDAILEMTGDFIVVNVAGKYTERVIKYFCGFEDGEADISRFSENTLHFDYESMANEVAERLSEDTGDEWHTVDLNPHETQMNRSFLEAIFSTEEE